MQIRIELNSIEGCPLSPILFDTYVDRVVKDWLQVIKQNILAKDLTLNTVFFADDQVVVATKVSIYTEQLKIIWRFHKIRQKR